MARLTIPNSFSSQQTLLLNMAAQHKVLAANSPLTSFLTQNQIVLDDDVAAGNAAQMHEANRALLTKQSENYRQLRDNAFKAPWNHVSTSTQYLKSFYKGNPKELGNWGLNITTSGKVNYPSAFTDRVLLFQTFAAKHNSYTDSISPLQSYFSQNNVDLSIDSVSIAKSSANHTAYITTAQQSEIETGLRNQLWLPVLAHIKAIGNFLMKLYINNPKALGAWGFVVDESARTLKLRTTKLKLGEKITGKSILIGSTITNIGGVDLHLYKGSTTSGAPTILAKGGQLGIVKGFGTITVVNPSELEEGRFTWMTNG